MMYKRREGTEAKSQEDPCLRSGLAEDSARVTSARLPLPGMPSAHSAPGLCSEPRSSAVAGAPWWGNTSWNRHVFPTFVVAMAALVSAVFYDLESGVFVVFYKKLERLK